ncbi:MAG: NTP transferase domain-containing protein [Alicyclobacillus sp.]|nr:NTP transferase domain-containing protein [Alicyclobacillus sp.]
MRCCAVVLAGGASRRMGRDKLALARLPQGRASVLQHVLTVARQVAERIYLLLPPDGTAADGCTHTAVADHVVRVCDRQRAAGPLAALADAWPVVRAGGPWTAVCVLAGDLPGVQPPVLHACLAALATSPAAQAALVVREGRLQPLLGAYRPAAGDVWAAARASGLTRLLAALDKLPVVAVAAEGWPDWWTRPLHTPADYTAWLAAAGACAGCTDEGGANDGKDARGTGGAGGGDDLGTRPDAHRAGSV